MARLARKAAVVVVLLAGLSWLFLKTLRDSNAEAYIVDRDGLSAWVLVVEDPERGGAALLALQPPAQLVGDVFRQIFTRTGQSLASPARASMPVLLAGEHAGIRNLVSRGELIEAATSAGLERDPLVPVCLGIRKELSSARPGQRFFLVLESSAFTRFREDVARLYKSRGGTGTFDPASLSPVLPVASTEPDFEQWRWPFSVNRAADCAAPVEAR
jgi:hypothetical protein